MRSSRSLGFGLRLVDVGGEEVGHFAPFLAAKQQFGAEGDRQPRIGNAFQPIEPQLGVAQLVLIQEHADVGRQIARIGLAAVDELFHLVPAALPIAAGQIQPGQLEAIVGLGLRPAGRHQAFRQFEHFGAAGPAGIGQEQANLEAFVLGARPAARPGCDRSSSMASLSLG